MVDGAIFIPQPLDDLVLITKIRREYRKDGKVTRSSDIYYIYSKFCVPL